MLCTRVRESVAHAAGMKPPCQGRRLSCVTAAGLVQPGAFSTAVSYISKTASQLQCDPHAAWTALYYSTQHRFDFWLRHIPPALAAPHAARVDAAVLRAAACLGYPGCLDDPLIRARIRLPARLHGLGLRSRATISPLAYAACFVEAAETLNLSRPYPPRRHICAWLLPLPLPRRHLRYHSV
eukprot:scaffold17641_cov122-Isochrysis_galbana.AAC.1